MLFVIHVVLLRHAHNMCKTSNESSAGFSICHVPHKYNKKSRVFFEVFSFVFKSENLVAAPRFSRIFLPLCVLMTCFAFLLLVFKNIPPAAVRIDGMLCVPVCFLQVFKHHGPTHEVRDPKHARGACHRNPHARCARRAASN